MGEVFSSSGEKTDNVVVPTPRLQGLFIPGIDNPEAVDGFGVVIPWGGGNTARRYADYGISTGRETQLNDLASSFIPAEGAGVTYNFEGLVGPQGIPGRDGIDGISHLIVAPNSNFLSALPHNIDQINALGTALDKIVYTASYETYLGDLTWTERRPAGDVNRDWYGVASDSDGSNLIAGVEIGRLYTSDDYGASWAERRPAGDYAFTWYSVASDSDGSHLIAAAYGHRLHTSDDYGASWAERRPAGDDDFDWDAVASDSDGSHLIAGINFGRLYTSSNYGASWAERRPAGDDDFCWWAVASDSDGSHLIAAIQGGRLYTSNNSGVSWTERKPAGDTNINWISVASDSDGSHLIAGVLSGRLYTSDDYGASWAERRPAGDSNQDWWGVASDSDGSNLIVAARTGKVYISDDSGVSWEIATGDADWRLVASDSDGSHLIAGIDVGRLYTGVRPVLYSEATWGESDLTSAGRDLLGDVDAAAQTTTLGLGTGDSPEFTGLTLSGLTASRLVASGSALASVADLTSWIAGTTNQIIVADDEDGTVTLSTPQNTHTGATPIFNQVILGIDPTNVDHSVTKSYADALVAGAFWEDVTVGTVANVDLSTGLEAGDTIDDYTLVENDRVLVKEQTDQTQNGLYTVPASGAASRSADANTAGEIEGKKCIPLNGSLTKHRFYFCITGDITLGVTDIKFAEVTMMTAHNTLSGLQGGQADQYYHLTAAEQAAVGALGATYQPLDTGLTNLAALGYVSDSMIKITAEDTYAIRTMEEVRTDLGLVIGTNVLAEQTIGIGDDNLVEIDDADAVATDYCKLTANGIQGRDATEVKTDLSLNNVENTAISGWVGSGNITTVGALASGSIAAGFTEIATARTAAKCIEATADNTAGNETSHANVVVDGDFGSNGILNRTGAGAYSILALGTDVQAYHANLAAIAGATWTGANSITTLGTIATGTWQATDVGISYGGTGQSTAQAAIDALTAVSGATNEHVLTKDTVSGNATWKVATGGGGIAFGRPIILTPQSSCGPASNFATHDTIAGGSTPNEVVSVLDFDAGASEYADFKFALPDGYAGGGLTVTVIFSMTSDHDEGTPHKVRWEVGFARIDDDGIAISGDHAYACNGVSAIVPSVVSEVSYDSITFTDGADMDSLAAGEMAILRIYRDHDHADDNATGDAELQIIKIKET